MELLAMRSLATRLARLEERFGLASRADGQLRDCTCTERPQCAITRSCYHDREPTAAEVSEMEKLAFTCPVHGALGPVLHFRLTAFACDQCNAATTQDHC